MTIDLPTLVAIVRRLEKAMVPLLFHEVRTPDRQASRIARIMTWMGVTGRVVVRDYLRNSSDREIGDVRLRFKRGGIV